MTVNRPLHVVFVFRAAPDTTDYYAHVLNRLDGVEGLKVTVIAGGSGVAVGQPTSLHHFTAIVCREEQWPDGECRLPDLPAILTQRAPDVVVTVPEYLASFRRDPALRRARRRNGFRLLLKSIPFRVPTLAEFRASKRARLCERVAVPSRWQRPLLRFGTGGGVLARLAGGLRLGVGHLRVWHDCRAQCAHWRLPDGHVNYVDDAVTVYGSYGVPAARIHVIGNSPDTDRHFALRAQVEQAGVRRSSHRLLHVGRMVAWKRVDLLLEAARRLRPRYPDLEVVVAGEGPMLEEWRALSARLGQQDYVRFVGGVYEPLAVARLFLESGIYVLAGMGGISINDAMCYGCAVVCAVCDGTERRLLRHGITGVIFQDGSADDLTATLDALLGNSAEQRRLARGGTATVLNEVNIYSVLRGYVRAFQASTGRDLAVSLHAIDDAEQRFRRAHQGVLV